MVSFRKILPLVLLISTLTLVSCIKPSPTPIPDPFITVIYPSNQIRASALGIAMLWEDFEDGDYTNGNRWQLASSDVIYDRRVVFEASGDDHFLLLEGPQEGEQGHGTGLDLNLKGNSIIGWIIPDHNGWKPNQVSFNIFAWSPRGNSTGSFLLKGYHPGDDSEVTAIEFFVDKNGEFSVNGTSYGPISQHWHLIEFKQIYWDQDETVLPRFNLYIDSALVGECLEFLAPIKGFYSIEVYNFHRGHTGYDNIMMINEIDSEGVAGCGPGDQNPPPEPPPPPPAPPDSQTGSPKTDPDAYIATARQDAACRQGPANEYPEVDYVNEGFSSPVLGRNADSNWLVVTSPNWGEECWIWEGLLETTGDINPVPVLPDPPLVLPDQGDGDGSDSDRGDSDGPSACLVFKMTGTKCISPCPPGANPGTPCTP